MQVYLYTYYWIKILLMGMFIYVKLICFFPQLKKTCKNVSSQKPYHFCMKDEMAILHSHTHTVSQNALNAILGHKKLIILTGWIKMSFNSGDSFWEANVHSDTCNV